MYSLMRTIPVLLVLMAGAGWEEARTEAASCEGTIMTVKGLISSDRLGRTLPHEHVAVDFESVEGRAYGGDTSAIEDMMIPRLKELAEAGYTALVECTPRFIGREPAMLKRISKKTGLHILTN